MTTSTTPEASPGVLGSSPAMRRVAELVQAAGRVRSGVLICGERGSGREMVARAIHARARSDNGAFVRMDCAGLAPQALEQELFGVLSPRREGAAERRAAERIAPESRLYEARGGTLFLEHVADMPGRVQQRLVRVLRDGEALVLGNPGRAVEPAPLDLNIRAMISVEPGFEAAIEDGRLRADLHERLAGVRIDLPPLRERREDIPLLAVHFLSEACRQRRVPPRSLTRAAVTLLMALAWRGNVAELRGLLDRLVVLVPQHLIRLEDVLAHVKLDVGPPPAGNGAATLREARRRFERDYIGAVLQQHQGRVGDAARVLGIQRTNLYRKVRQLQVVRPVRRRREG